MALVSVNDFVRVSEPVETRCQSWPPLFALYFADKVQIFVEDVQIGNAALGENSVVLVDCQVFVRSIARVGVIDFEKSDLFYDLKSVAVVLVEDHPILRDPVDVPTIIRVARVGVVLPGSLRAILDLHYGLIAFCLQSLLHSSCFLLFTFFPKFTKKAQHFLHISKYCLSLKASNRENIET